MTATFLVVGMGTFGRMVAKTLAEGGAFVLAVDREEERVNAVREEVSKAVCCDASDRAAMAAVGAYDMETAIVSLRNHFDVTVLVTHALKRNGVQQILVQVDNDLQAEAVLALGATETIYPPRDMALRMGKKLLHPDLADRIPLGGDVSIIEMPCPKSFAGQTIGGLALRTHYGVNLVALRIPAGPHHGKEQFMINPPPETRLESSVHLLVLGTMEQLTKIRATP